MSEQRIDLGDERSVKYWCGQLGLSAAALTAFVDEFGTDPYVIRAKLAGHERAAPEPETMYPPTSPHTNPASGRGSKDEK